ncbi:MAG: 2-hydroxyacyl-CoA dehydratase [Firmicutes bacterium]|nr:2-hydroxyacyl-CoA dehydratase [Bacillota bacterium]
MRVPRLQCLPAMNRLLGRHYLGARYRKLLHPLDRPPVAWVTSGAPVEILRAMGIVSVYPENYAALVAARKQGAALCQVAEEGGYSRDLCSYARIHLGSVLDPGRAPLGGLPRPDLLVACNNICGTVVKWYQELSRLLDVPLFLLDTPFLYGEESEDAIGYVRTQLEELVGWLEQVTRRRLDAGRLRRTVDLAARATALWEQIRRLGRHRPSPLNVPDLLLTLGPVVTVRGTPEAVAFYRALQAELEDRVRRGVAAVPGERVRLLWDNIAIWYRLYRFFQPFVERGACFVADTYTAGWSVHLEGNDPLEALAQAYTTVFLNQGVTARARQIATMVEEYGVDGVVMHHNRSCKPYSGIQPVLARLLGERGIPVLLVEADMADPRAYVEETTRNRVEAFLERFNG